MQVVQSVQKVSHVSSQHRQHSIVPILAYKVDEKYSHLVHELAFRYIEELQKFKKII